jgi:hypothetical protein
MKDGSQRMSQTVDLYRVKQRRHDMRADHRETKAL